MPGQSPNFHGTRLELQYLTGLGSHGEHDKDRKALLKKYLEAAKLRTNWVGVDKDLVLAHCWRMIGEE